MAGKIIADTIEASGSQITLNVGNVTIFTASSTGFTLIPTNNVNINIANSSFTTANITGITTFSAGTIGAPSITTAGDTNTGLYFPAADTIGFVEGGVEAMRINSGGQVEYIAGTAALPAITTTGDTDTGIFFPAANTIAFSEGGTEAMRINSGGQVEYIAGSNTAPSITTTGDTNTGLYFPAADTIAFTEGGVESMRINSSGNVGIGTASVVYPLTLGNNKQFGTLNPSGNSVALAIMDSGSNLYLGDSSANSNFLSIQSKSGAVFNVDGTQIMRVSSNGVFATSTGGLGYGGGGGAGGTVTQATSKSTAVTLNKNTGQITTHNAALTAGASVIFTLTNSTILATDTLITNHSSTGGTTSSYTIQCLTCAAGSATIRVTNITGGSLSEALVINFAVIKGTTL